MLLEAKWQFPPQQLGTRARRKQTPLSPSRGLGSDAQFSSLLLSFPQNQPWWSPNTFWFNLLVLLRNLLTVTNWINLPRAKQRCFQRFWHRLGDQKLRPALQGCISNLIAEGNVGYLTLPLNCLSVNAGSWTAPHLPVETSKRRGAANWASPSLALPEPPPAIARGCLGDF